MYFYSQIDSCGDTAHHSLRAIQVPPESHYVHPECSAKKKKEILVRVAAFNPSGFDRKVLGNIVYYHKSFVGWDYKVWAQQSLFIIGPYLLDAQKQV